MKYLIILHLLTYLLFAEYTKAQKEKYLYPLGKRIAKENCLNIEKKHFISYNQLYNYIQENCHLKQERYNDAFALYLWEKHTKHRDRYLPKLNYKKTTKCPVCGMFIYKYPAWATMMEVGGKKYYFDGVKDMLKYYFEKKPTDPKLYAQDYYTKKIFELHKGYLVTGSDLYGPMGEELIPFESKKMAEKFMFDHKGMKIYAFKQLRKRDVFALDE